MAVPVSQMWTVATYVLGQKLRGRKQYPLVLMLEPLFRCNLACAGCGKIQYPAHVLKMQLTPEECFRAVDECGAPTVAIPAIQGWLWNIPTRIRNSPTKPFRPGRPIDDSVTIMKRTAKTGITAERPPNCAISYVCRRS